MVHEQKISQNQKYNAYPTSLPGMCQLGDLLTHLCLSKGQLHFLDLDDSPRINGAWLYKDKKILTFKHNDRVYPRWIRTFIEFTEFSESDKSLKHELGLI